MKERTRKKGEYDEPGSISSNGKTREFKRRTGVVAQTQINIPGIVYFQNTRSPETQDGQAARASKVTKN